MATNKNMKAKPYYHQQNTNAAASGGGGGGYSSESSNGGSNSPSPPPSPRRHSSISHSRRRLRTKSFSFFRRDSFALTVSFIFRRNLRYLVLLCLLYVSGLIMCVGPFAGLVGHTPVPGSVYRSHEIFGKLWDQIQSDNSSAIDLSSVWKYKRLKVQKPCLNSTVGRYFGIEKESPGPSGFLIVEANGGLNQQRSAICNAVAVAGLLNAILVIPRFEFNSVWKDPRVIRIAPFANRLAMNVPPHIQLLRCMANYKALRFSDPISTLAEKLVKRMIEKSSGTGGKYVSIHLRFEEDMVAFSCCLYDGGKAEKLEMDMFREKWWKGKFKRKDRVILPGLNRINGKCPLTPLEHRLG
ncbi:O-fucosyltransferase 11 [Citrus sinensis]|uniref:O-fucosyltransferase 11 n=1 Tax=Citrus sinensis TaxID=2711 RepID=A0ACB8KRF5_CITSI|nr:O-fucosyltransferase 11 [Citrus sinensis]